MMSRQGFSRGFRLFVLLSLMGTANAAAAGPTFDIYFIDVMGGAATLLVTPQKESVLIDCGWPGMKGRDAERIETVLTKLAKADHLDHLVITHWHMDHYGGTEELAKRVRIDHYWDRGLPDLSAADQDAANYPDGPKKDDPLGKAYRIASKGKRKPLSAGDKFPLGGVEALVLASGGKVLKGAGLPNPACESDVKDLPTDPSDNARSLALRFQIGRFTFLDCGDLTWNVEKQLVCPTNRIGQVDLFQVTHHGMAISNHPTLLESIQPVVAVIDNGPNKGGDSLAFKRLKGLRSIEAIYQLHKNASTGASDNTDPAYIANTDKSGGEFIKVSVQPDGSSFTVQIGEKGTPKRFETR